MSTALRSLSQQEQLNFLLTNRIPRRLATRLMGWYAGIRSPALTRVSIAVWQRFADDLKLDEAAETHFETLEDCFTRRLKPGARPIDDYPDVLVSPCDAVIGAHGKVEQGRLYQAKGFPYELRDLIPDAHLQQRYQNGIYVTLRLKSSMYHRFHAPVECSLRRVTYISGDTWNVNPVALKRVEKLYCRNERAVLNLELNQPESGVCLVPVAAILVASIKLNCLEEPLGLQYQGPEELYCNAEYTRGEEMGYFRHGSTIVLFATSDHELLPQLIEGTTIRMGQALLRRTACEGTATATTDHHVEDAP